jgi:hypothetical protein
MRNPRLLFLVAALVFLATAWIAAADFGVLETARPDAVKARAIAWLKDSGKFDAAIQKQVEAIWRQKDRSVLERLADTFALGNAEARTLLTEARDPKSPAPTKIPSLLTDPKQPVFFRANLALAYGRALSLRRVYEEALAVLKTARGEDVVDPAGYFFQRAVCEYSLLQKAEAEKSINRLVDEVKGPERYQIVAVLMLMDMQTWKEKDLAAVARKMGNIERRLELARGGPETQKLQKDVIRRLDELIKELEKKNPPGDGPSPPDPKSGDPKGARRPPDETPPPGGPGGTGKVFRQRFDHLKENWGNMQPRQREEALQQLTRGMPPRYREAIENYFRNLTKNPRK